MRKHNFKVTCPRKVSSLKRIALRKSHPCTSMWMPYEWVWPARRSGLSRLLVNGQCEHVSTEKRVMKTFERLPLRGSNISVYSRRGSSRTHRHHTDPHTLLLSNLFYQSSACNKMPVCLMKLRGEWKVTSNVRPTFRFLKIFLPSTLTPSAHPPLKYQNEMSGRYKTNLRALLSVRCK